MFCIKFWLFQLHQTLYLVQNFCITLSQKSAFILLYHHSSDYVCSTLFLAKVQIFDNFSRKGLFSHGIQNRCLFWLGFCSTKLESLIYPEPKIHWGSKLNNYQGQVLLLLVSSIINTTRFYTF